jgi:pimeloyl-ACP methyl ester carboxylesterase
MIMAKQDLEWLSREKFPVWEARGAERKSMAEACTKAGDLLEGADSKGGWTYEFMCLGGARMGEARSPAHAGRKGELFRKASVYYGIAKYPYIDSLLKRDAYSRQRTALSEGRKYIPYAVREVRIPFMDSEIVGRFASPRPGKEITLPEAVLLAGGADAAKEDLADIEYEVLDRGMACLSIDMPGTGESAWRLSESSIDAYLKAIHYLATVGNVDVNRIGVFGLGFGGYWALYCGSACPDVKAVVNCGSPVHKAFMSDRLDKLPGFMKKTLAFDLGLNPKKPEEVKKGLDGLSEYSLLREQRLQDVTCPVLSINGDLDPWVPIDDLFILSEEGGIAQEEWVFPEDGHCAPYHYKEWMPRAVNWLANQLGGKERVPRPEPVRL